MATPDPLPAPTLRLAAEPDVPAVVALVERAYRGEASRGGWTTEADLLDGQRTDAAAVRAVVEARASRLLLLDGRDGLLACCSLTDHGAGVVHLGMFAVAPEAQGGGTGRRVLAAAEASAERELGARVVEMAVLVQREDLLAWYARRGYAPTGERRPFPYGDDRFGLPRRDDLEFLVIERPLRP